MSFIGIDVSKDKLDVCCIFGERHRSKRVANSPSGFEDLMRWIVQNKFEDVHVCMESTGCYSEGVAEFLYNAGFKVSVANPAAVKAFKNSELIRQKTDKADAYMIAKFCQKSNPRLWTPRHAEIRELHDITSRIASLRRKIIASSNVLENKSLSEVVVKNINNEIEFLEKNIKELEDKIMKIIESNEDLKLKFERLTAITGVDPKVALAILAGMPDIENFQNAGQFASFVGITPSHKQSGTSVHGKSPYIKNRRPLRQKIPVYERFERKEP